VLRRFPAKALVFFASGLRWGRRNCRLRQLGEHPAIPGIPTHFAHLIGSQDFPASKCQHYIRRRYYLDLNLAFIPGVDASMSERFFFKMFAGDGLHLKTFSFDGQPPLSIATRRFFQERPGPQYPVMNNSQVKVRPAGFVLMDDES
jgi:hypothetical protein